MWLCLWLCVGVGGLRSFFQPFKGGYGFIALQIFAWSLLGCSLVCCYVLQVQWQPHHQWLAYLFKDAAFGGIAASAGVTGWCTTCIAMCCIRAAAHEEAIREL